MKGVLLCVLVLACVLVVPVNVEASHGSCAGGSCGLAGAGPVRSVVGRPFRALARVKPVRRLGRWIRGG